MVRLYPADKQPWISHNPNMPKRSAKTQRDFKHTWFLREWLQQSDPPLTQADVQRALGWSKAKAHDVWHGQQYTQALVDELSVWLKVRPFELLLPPSEAIAIRQMRESAVKIVSSQPEEAVTVRSQAGVAN
jgi:hypothetical protein